jgi:hypothetical protein
VFDSRLEVLSDAAPIAAQKLEVLMRWACDVSGNSVAEDEVIPAKR